MQITIYTDGACDIHAANRPGGWAAILVAADDAGAVIEETVISGGAEMTTNNRMELNAAIEGLKLLRQAATVRIVSDSRYVIDIASGRKRARTNADLWREYREVAAGHDIRWSHIAGHSGHVYNERCDKLAVAEKNKLARPAAPHAARESEVQIYLSTRYAAAKRLSVWAAAVVHGARIDEMSGRYPGKTEQEAALLAARTCLESIGSAQSVTLFTAQEYLSKGMTQWTRNWMRTGWKTREGKPVKYREHWQALVKLAGERDTAFIFVKARKEQPHFQRGAKLTAALLKGAE